MKKKAASFVFHLEIGILLVFVRAKLSFMRRDIVEFQKHGITEDNLAEAETMATQFEGLSNFFFLYSPFTTSHFLNKR